MTWGWLSHPAAIWVLFDLVRKSVFTLERKGWHKYEKEIIQVGRQLAPCRVQICSPMGFPSQTVEGLDHRTC